MITKIPSSNEILWFYCMSYVTCKALCKYSELSSFPRTMNCNWWHTRPLWNHSRNPRASGVGCFPPQMPSHKRWKAGEKTRRSLPLRKDLLVGALTVLFRAHLSMEHVMSWKPSFIFNYWNTLFWQIIYLNCCCCLFFWTIVHGLKDSLHSTGDLNHPACKIYQWCPPATRRGGGEDSWVLNHLKIELKILCLICQKQSAHTANSSYSRHSCSGTLLCILR